MLKILGIPTAVDNTYQYRVWLPFQALERAGLAQTFVMQLQPGDYMRPLEPGVFARFDVVIFQRQVVNLGILQTQAKAVCLVIYEVDDHFLAMDPTNPAYLRIGGNEEELRRQWQMLQTLSPEETPDALKLIRMLSPKDMLGQIKMDRQHFAMNARNAHRVTVSTKPLVRVMEDYNPDVVVLPNLVEPRLWEKIEPKPVEDGKIRLGWSGGDSHLADLEIMRKPLERIFERYNNVVLRIIGFPFVDRILFDRLPADRVETIGWCEWMQTQHALSQCDIILAPSKFSQFNRCKSPIRVYEGLMATRGRAAIVSSYTTYGRTVEELKCGIVALRDGDWSRALSLLIEDEKQRQRYGGQGYQYLLDHLTYDQHIQKWVEAYSIPPGYDTATD